MDIVQIKETPLSTLAQMMRDGELPYPPIPTDDIEEQDSEYPEFPDAITEIEREMEVNDSHPKCVSCQIIGYYYPADRGYAPGHCYSEAGVTEFTRISQCCEFCFDLMFKEDDE